jgi:hypothetical protein
MFYFCQVFIRFKKDLSGGVIFRSEIAAMKTTTKNLRSLIMKSPIKKAKRSKNMTSTKLIYLSWFYHGLTYNPAAITQVDINEYVSHYSAPGGMHAAVIHS